MRQMKVRHLATDARAAKAIIAAAIKIAAKTGQKTCPLVIGQANAQRSTPNVQSPTFHTF
jgi:hypothetical protein